MPTTWRQQFISTTHLMARSSGQCKVSWCQKKHLLTHILSLSVSNNPLFWPFVWPGAWLTWVDWRSQFGRAAAWQAKIVWSMTLACGYYTTLPINFLHFLQYTVSSLQSFQVWQYFSTTALPSFIWPICKSCIFCFTVHPFLHPIIPIISLNTSKPSQPTSLHHSHYVLYS